MPHVGPTTEVDQRSTAVDGGLGLCDLVMDDTALELVVLHQTREVEPLEEHYSKCTYIF